MTVIRVMTGSGIFHLSLLGFLLLFLFVSVGRRWLERVGKRSYWEGCSDRGAFNVTQISACIEELRRNYVAIVHSRPHGLSNRRRLIAGAKRAVISLPYFRSSKSESQTVDQSTH